MEYLVKNKIPRILTLDAGDFRRYQDAFDAFVAERLGGDLNGLTLEEAFSEFRAYEAELRTIQSKLDKAEEQYARGEAKPIDKDAFLADVNRRLDERGIPN